MRAEPGWAGSATTLATAGSSALPATARLQEPLVCPPLSAGSSGNTVPFHHLPKATPGVGFADYALPSDH